jgi:hypothetical protein
MRSKLVFVSVSSLETHHPVYHKSDAFGYYTALRMRSMAIWFRTQKMECGQLTHDDCYAMPIRHAEKIASPCLNCFREERR